jgi:hypothetical protein
MTPDEDPIAVYQAAAAESMGQVVCDTIAGHEVWVEAGLDCPVCGAVL